MKRVIFKLATLFLVLSFCFSDSQLVHANEVINTNAEFVSNADYEEADVLEQDVYDDADDSMDSVIPVETASTSTKKVKVLFIGSSFTYRQRGDNHTLEYLKNMATKQGKSIEIKKVIHGGERFTTWASRHKYYGKLARKAIRSKNWNYVVFQDTTNYIVRGSRKELDAIVRLAKYVHRKHPRTTIIYDVTWAHQYTSTWGGKRYTPKLKYSNLYKNYAKVYRRTSNYSVRCFSGEAFNAYNSQKRHRNLFIKDREHPNRNGAYLHAVCLYTTIFKSDPRNIKYNAGISKTTTQKMKRYAAEKCLGKK